MAERCPVAATPGHCKRCLTADIRSCSRGPRLLTARSHHRFEEAGLQLVGTVGHVAAQADTLCRSAWAGAAPRSPALRTRLVAFALGRSGSVYWAPFRRFHMVTY